MTCLPYEVFWIVTQETDQRPQSPQSLNTVSQDSRALPEFAALMMLQATCAMCKLVQEAKEYDQKKIVLRYLFSHLQIPMEGIHQTKRMELSSINPGWNNKRFEAVPFTLSIHQAPGCRTKRYLRAINGKESLILTVN